VSTTRITETPNKIAISLTTTARGRLSKVARPARRSWARGKCGPVATLAFAGDYTPNRQRLSL